MSDYLPLEIVQQVLLRLPIKSILCCSAICKAWYNLITSSEFISEHLDFTKKLPSSTYLSYLLIEDYFAVEEKHNAFYVLYSDDEAGNFKEYTRIKFPDEKARHLLAVGSCNGLICLAKNDPSATEDHAQETVNWNPMIQRSLYLPKPDTPFRYLEASKAMGMPCSKTFGFVFDRNCNDYKVLRICSAYGIPSTVEVFRLSTGSWEDISYKASFHQIWFSSFQVDLKGFAHWLGSDNNDESAIVTFDVCEEVFGCIELPVIALNDDEMYARLLWQNYLFAFEGSLFLIRSAFASNEDKYKLEIWKMGEYNVVESWNQVHTWDFHIYVRPLGFRRNGEILWVLETGELISTNLADASTNYLGICPNASYRTPCLDYEESLILLDKSFTKWSW